ncbi:hypothetical protein GCM10007933_26700 [Zoogloea oryzae]|uniref:Uncharacterized protein n=1 Tax=Zoogloea oryzae TaxID=310767 RepID=A0ABQ6FDA2_9RHOO|nr:hypothetical protein GCM10007933_26700 [Zoogloea oryzae]
MTAWAACLLAASLAPDAGAQYAGSSAITTWGGQCGGSQRNWWDDMCMAWRHKMGDKGWVQWWRNFHLVQGNRYADNPPKSWGIDDTGSGIDWNDAGLMCLHGGWGSGRWTGTIYDKDPDGSCSASSSKMRLGWNSGGWMRFMHLSSCNSIRYSQRTQWFDAAQGVHVITGFHGLMYIGSSYVDEYRDLASEAMNSRGVARAWIDNMHHVDHWYNSYKTICPVAVGFGATAAAAQAIHDETYNGHWAHPTPNWMHTRWNSGCNPDDGPALPN